jgi:hypothetical protein
MYIYSITEDESDNEQKNSEYEIHCEMTEPPHKPRLFIEEWKDHNQDASLYLFYRSLCASYTFMDRVLSLIEINLQKVYHHFVLIPRGSTVTKTALKFACDLDIDLILPLSLYKKYSDVNSNTWSK